MDIGRIAYDSGKFFWGGGVSYALYSEIVTDILGFSGKIANKNLLGAELFGGMRLKQIIGKLGYSSSLGVRASVGYEF